MFSGLFVGVVSGLLVTGEGHESLGLRMVVLPVVVFVDCWEDVLEFFSISEFGGGLKTVEAGGRGLGVSNLLEVVEKVLSVVVVWVEGLVVTGVLGVVGVGGLQLGLV